MKYLLPCQKCGEKTPIDVHQAGQQIACDCGQMLGVPSLRGIRELETLGEVDTAVPQSAWSVGRRVAFVVGLVVCVIGLAIFGLATLNRSYMGNPERPVFDVARSDADIDALTPTQAWDAWGQLRAEGLGHYREPGYLVARGVVRTLQIVMAVAASVAAVGLLMALGTCFFPRARRSP